MTRSGYRNSERARRGSSRASIGDDTGRRHAEYRRPADHVEVLGINDPVARRSGLLAGSIHLMNHVNPKVAAIVEKNSQLQLFNVSAGAHYCFPILRHRALQGQ
jgi:hypothetical protein